MKTTIKALALLSAGFISSMAMADPSYLVTHNKTSVESNAFVDGVIPSAHPTAAHSDGSVAWPLVRLACFGRTTNNMCKAIIKMRTNTNNPVELGWVEMNVNTGDIMPKTLSANGYTLQVVGVAEVELLED